MNKPAFIKTNSSVTCVYNGKSYTMHSTNANFKQVVSALKRGDGALAVKLFDIKEAISQFTKNVVKIVNGQVMYNGEVVHNTVCDRILSHMREGKSARPLIRFLEKLLKNTSYRVREQLYKFLEHENIPIAEDGDILAYKSVRPNWTDWWTGTISNAIGQSPSMPRENVCDDPNIGCAAGLHSGSFTYSYDYNNSLGRHLIIVKINPSDVVSIPQDCSYRKMRCCKYTVVGEIDENQQPLNKKQYRIDKKTNTLSSKLKRDHLGRFCK